MQLYGIEEETMEHWDEEQLKNVVSQNERKYTKQKPTEIVCKFFLDAIEKEKYNWNWTCPNGMNCHYRHCLPPNFVFKKKNEKKEKVESNLEEEIDQERSKLDSNKANIKVSFEVFMKWKEERRIKKEQEIELKKKADAKKTKS